MQGCKDVYQRCHLVYTAMQCTGCTCPAASQDLYRPVFIHEKWAYLVGRLRFPWLCFSELVTLKVHKWNIRSICPDQAMCGWFVRIDPCARRTDLKQGLAMLQSPIETLLRKKQMRIEPKCYFRSDDSHKSGSLSREPYLVVFRGLTIAMIPSSKPMLANHHFSAEG